MISFALITDYSITDKSVEKVIDSAFKKIVKSKIENMELHFVYAGIFWTGENGLSSFILKVMKKYKIKKVMVTMIQMWRVKLSTKEKMETYCKGKHIRKESVNDDLESLFEAIRFGKEPIDFVRTYFLPKLTAEELQLVEGKDNDFMYTFLHGSNADVEKSKMEASKSDSKFVFAWGQRKTCTVEDSEKLSSNCSLQ